MLGVPRDEHHLFGIKTLSLSFSVNALSHHLTGIGNLQGLFTSHCTLATVLHSLIKIIIPCMQNLLAKHDTYQNMIICV